jgi:FkbM family methyltransferase
MTDNIIIAFYRFWHGFLGMRGAGRLLTITAGRSRSLHSHRMRLPEGHFLELDFRDVSAMYWLNHTLGDPFEEKGLLTAMRPFLNEDSVVWDIGANSGLLSYHIAREFPCRELHLFEPNPRMSRLAAEAIAVFPKAVIHAIGLSNREGEFTLTIPLGHTTMATLEPDATHRSGTSCTISCRTGDALVSDSGFKPPSIVKIDTEGHEPAVIAGLAKTIAAYRPVIFCEHISLDVNALLAMLPPGYRLFTVCDHDGSMVEGAHEGLGHNSALIP